MWFYQQHNIQIPLPLHSPNFASWKWRCHSLHILEGCLLGSPPHTWGFLTHKKLSSAPTFSGLGKVMFAHLACSSLVGYLLMAPGDRVEFLAQSLPSHIMTTTQRQVIFSWRWESFQKTNSSSQGLSKVWMLALKDLLLAKSMRYSSNWIKSSHALWYNSRTSLNPSCYLFLPRPRTPEMEALPSRLCWLFLPRPRTQKWRLFQAGSVGYWTCFPYFYPGIERRHCFWLTSIYRLISRIFDSKVSPGIVCVREPLKFW